MAVSHAEQHAILTLAAIRTEAHADRLDDQGFRLYVAAVTESLDLPAPGLTVLPGGDDAA